MEALETLAGNYGEEGDKLLFKVLNNGDFLKDVEDSFLTDKDSFGIIRHISKRGLRYDLTVPFARYIVMNRQHIQYNLSGERTNHKRVVIRNSTNVMPMSQVLIHCITKLS